MMLPWRRLLGNRTVRRNVQGVTLYLPWSHALPDYARARSYYGQNLVDLAEVLARRDPSTDGLRFVDIGANIGDSALQVLNRVEGRALCVEGDEYWARYLRMNVDADPRVTIEEAMLTPAEMDSQGARPVRGLGTTTFVMDGETDGSARWLQVPELRARHPEFADARLIKSDTDGFDPLLVPALARAWSQSSPVLFFEYYPTLARRVGARDPAGVWDELAELGYSRFAVWDNTGDRLGQLDLEEVHEAAARLEPPPVELGYSFWDIAACRADDAEAAAAFDELVDFPFHPAGPGG